MPLHFTEVADQRQPLVLKLPDPLPPHPEFFAHLYQCGWLAHHPRPHPKDVPNPVIELVKLAFPEGVERYWRKLVEGHLEEAVEGCRRDDL